MSRLLVWLYLSVTVGRTSVCLVCRRVSRWLHASGRAIRNKMSIAHTFGTVVNGCVFEVYFFFVNRRSLQNAVSIPPRKSTRKRTKNNAQSIINRRKQSKSAGDTSVIKFALAAVTT